MDAERGRRPTRGPTEEAGVAELGQARRQVVGGLPKVSSCMKRVSGGHPPGQSLVHILKNGFALCGAGASYSFPPTVTWVSYLDYRAGVDATCKECIQAWETLPPDAEGPTQSQPNIRFCAREPKDKSEEPHELRERALLQNARLILRVG